MNQREIENETETITQSLINRCERKFENKIAAALTLYEQRLVELQRQLDQQWRKAESDSRIALQTELKYILEDYRRELSKVIVIS